MSTNLPNTNATTPTTNEAPRTTTAKPAIESGEETESRLTKAQQRRLAIGAVAKEIDRTTTIPQEVTASDARSWMDDIARRDPTLVVSQWYLTASSHQLTLFEREWNRRYRAPGERKAASSQAPAKPLGRCARLNQEASGKIVDEMCERGFVSVFQHIKPAMFESQTVWTLWINVGSGEEVLTVIDAQGGHTSFKLVPYVTSTEQN